ncbi:MAG: PA0069 family radical SAM protein [Crocinitomicaceae bacterium]|nr:PA0069 family radical SAM protein [Crocinitomicaceae bacterium]
MNHDDEPKFSGRGSGYNPTNRFEKHSYSDDDKDGMDVPLDEAARTKYVDIFPKSVVNKVTSPDVGMDYSLNPYQGCEHGCTYCYARPTHEFWGLSAGLDFEQVILVKKNAPDLLRKTLDKKSWVPRPIVLSGNTDCYQPADKKFGLTRELLKVFLEYRNPVGIITKNVLMNRDLDVIEELADLNLIGVNLSITTLDEELRRKLEPRTATAKRKLDLVEKLANINVPVNVMASPIIPALNDHEILAIAKAASERGAASFHSHVVRLMGPNEKIFEQWVNHHYPDRAQKVMNQVRDIHGGKSGSSTFGDRMKGTGAFALNIRRQRALAKRKYFPNSKSSKLRTDLFRRPSGGQLFLFD